MNRKKTIEVKSLSFGYRDTTKLLNDVNFSLCEGDVMTLLGPNGSGKSTLLSCIMNFITDYDGKINICGKDVKSYSARKLASLVAFVPQLNELAFDYCVKDFIVMGRNAYLGYFEQPSKEDYEIVDKYQQLLGISALSDRSISELSGGERQLVYIARALVQEPKIIILDEPTSALDYGNSIKMIDIINKLKCIGYTIIMTSHNPNQPLEIGGYAGILNREHEFYFGTVEEILNGDILSKLYDTNIQIIYLEEVRKWLCVNL